MPTVVPLRALLRHPHAHRLDPLRAALATAADLRWVPGDPPAVEHLDAVATFDDGDVPVRTWLRLLDDHHLPPPHSPSPSPARSLEPLLDRDHAPIDRLQRLGRLAARLGAALGPEAAVYWPTSEVLVPSHVLAQDPLAGAIGLRRHRDRATGQALLDTVGGAAVGRPDVLWRTPRTDAATARLLSTVALLVLRDTPPVGQRIAGPHGELVVARIGPSPIHPHRPVVELEGGSADRAS